MNAVPSDRLADHVSLWDWRRQVAALYGAAGAAAGDPAAAWSSWRRGRDELFAAHPQSPLPAVARRRFEALPFFPYDPGLRFDVALVPATGAIAENMLAGADGTVALRPFARTSGLAARLGGELVVYWIELYGGGVFLPFGDRTNGGGTYAGGRYLLDTIKGADLGGASGRAIIDFNFAYNPSCAYSDRWVCPLAPSANRLPSAIEAGEMAPTAVTPER